MASVFAHAAVPLITRGAFDWREVEADETHLGRRLTIASVALACWPDLDYVGLVFEIRPSELLGHRGITHSLLASAVLSVACAAVFFRALSIGSRAWWRVTAFLFGAAASHGLLDAMTTGDIGVALFAPLENGRHMLPLALVPMCPGGLNEYFGYWGLLTIANELLYVVIPLALLVTLVRGSRRRGLFLCGAWVVIVVLLRVAMPDSFTPTVPRVLMPVDTLDAGMLADIPKDDLPGAKLVTKLEDLRALGLFDKALLPAKETWSSSFFPTWFGGEGGRWMDGTARLAWRTMFGFQAPTEQQARAWLTAANAGDADAQRRLFTLAPTEKLDLALGQLAFPITNQSIGRTHNASPKPRYWSGRCNGIATASLTEPEPFRVVDVIAADGSHVRFHPNDVKSFLALAYDQPHTMTVIGNVCTTLAFDAPATCSMNPAVLVVALLNRIGIAKQSFLIDALPTIAKQYYAVASARVHVGTERPQGKTPADKALGGRIASVVDVGIELTLSSTTLAYARANVVDAHDPTRYARVGVVPVVMKYSATLAVDASGELIGGRWTGEAPDGPDDVLIVGGGPTVLENGKLATATEIPWSLVRELARASADESAALPTLDLRTHCDGRCN